MCRFSNETNPGQERNGGRCHTHKVSLRYKWNHRPLGSPNTWLWTSQRPPDLPGHWPQAAVLGCLRAATGRRRAAPTPTSTQGREKSCSAWAKVSREVRTSAPAPAPAPTPTPTRRLPGTRQGRPARDRPAGPGQGTRPPAPAPGASLTCC